MQDDLHHHGHAHHDHTAGRGQAALAVTLALTLSFLLAEVAGAWWFGSLALLSDAAHMFTDAAALGIALLAARFSKRAPDAQHTYGHRRFEVLAAAFNAVLLVLVAAWILFEAIRRFLDPPAVEALGMLVIAVLGLVVNLIGMRILGTFKDHSLNMKGAYLELWADALGSVGVIAGALLIWATGRTWIDPVVAVAIALWVLPRAFALLSQSTQILMQAVPPGLSLESLRQSIAAVGGVVDVHDLHVWSIAGSDVSLTAHVVLTPGASHDGVRAAVVAQLDAHHGIHHVTIQTEDTCCPIGDHIHV